MPKEKYIPIPEEAQKAEEMMTPEQKVATEEREQFFIQEGEKWDDEAWVGHNEVRRIPSEEEQKRMDETMKRLGALFNGSNVKWQLDGALNISLMRGGDYIGVHKDTDISIEPNDLEALDAHLSKKGYGLFLSYAENPHDEKSKKLMKRVDARGFREASALEHYIIAAIDKKGKIVKGVDQLDTHLIQRNADGQPTGYEGAVLLEEWMEPQPTEFQGETINVSHPARVAYYKLHMGRKYDMKDLELLAETGELSSADMDAIGDVMKQESENFKERGAAALRPVWEKFSDNMSAEDIFELFAKDSNFSASAANPEVEKKFRDFAEQIAKAKDKSFENILEIGIKMFQGPGVQEQEDRLHVLRQMVKDAEEKNKLRENI